MLLTMQQFTILPLREKRSHIYMLFTCIPEAKNDPQIVTLIDIVTSTEDEKFLADLYEQILLSTWSDPMEALTKIYTNNMQEIHQKFTITSIKAQEYNQQSTGSPDDLLTAL